MTLRTTIPCTNSYMTTLYVALTETSNAEVGDIELHGRKEMFYLTTHSTHFIYGYMTYGKGPFKEEICCHHYMGFSPINISRVFYMYHPTDRRVHTTAFVIPVEHWLE